MRHRLVASLPTGGMGAHQSNRSIRSPLQSSGVEQEDAATPRPDPVPAPHRPPVCERLGPNQNAHSIINNQRQARCDDDAHQGVVRAGHTGPGQTIKGSRETHPRHGHQPNDQSPSPEGLGPRALDWRIRRAPFPPRFRPPTNITKYTRETNPGIWLKDFRLACRAGGLDDDYFII